MSTSTCCQHLLDPFLALLVRLSHEAGEAEYAQVARLEDLERVDHPDRACDYDQAGGEADERVVEIPLAARSRRHEAQQDRVCSQARRPEIEVRSCPPLRETDA